MLLELDVRDFAIIDHLHVRFAPGFNVLTGETGAGKSIIVDAVAQILGERADSEIIRAGAERAQVEAVFDVGDIADRIEPTLLQYGVASEPELILRREIHATGRSTARVNGRAVPVRALSELGALLVDIHGQSEHVSLKREAEHVELLDRYARLERERADLAKLVARVREVTAEMGRLQRDEAELVRRAELLAFQVDEIETARPSVEEEADLLAERTRLANSERLATLADRAYTALRSGEADRFAALDLIDTALENLERLVQIDSSLRDLRDGAADTAEVLGGVASRLLAYRDGLDFSAERLEEVEERLGLIADLKRKFGPDIPAVLAYAERASDELASLSSAEERLGTLAAEREQLRLEIGGLAAEVSERRRGAGQQLARAVEVELEELGMPGSRFEVSLERRPDPEGVPVGGEQLAFGATGIDRVAFLVSTNPGEPPRPLVRVASGGETARLMLALKSILTVADPTPSLIFDEIDAGIGGRIGAIVGQKLWGVAERHQVLCVTHLPQVAAFADTHFCVRKAVVDERTTAEVVPVVEGSRVAELTLMLGSPTNIARENAVQLLQHSELWKVTQKHARESSGT